MSTPFNRPNVNFQCGAFDHYPNAMQFSDLIILFYRHYHPTSGNSNSNPVGDVDIHHCFYGRRTKYFNDRSLFPDDATFEPFRLAYNAYHGL